MNQNINLISNDELQQILDLIEKKTLIVEAKEEVPQQKETKGRSQHKKNLALLDSAQNLNFSEINQLIKDGADIHCFKRAYPNQSFFQIILKNIVIALNPETLKKTKTSNALNKESNNLIKNHDNNAEVKQNDVNEFDLDLIEPKFLNNCIEMISFLLINNASLRQYQNTKTSDTSDENITLWKTKWAQVLTQFHPTISNKIIEKTQQYNKNNSIPFIPKRIDLFEMYLQAKCWVHANSAQQLFSTTTSTEFFSKALHEQFVNFIFTKNDKDKFEPQKNAIYSLINKNKHLVNINCVIGLYNCALRNDNPELLLCTLATGLKPELFNIDPLLQISTTIFTNNSNNYKKQNQKKHLVFVAIKNDSTKCLEIIKKIPFLIADFNKTNLMPSDIGNLQLNQIKTLESLGFNIEAQDNDMCNFLHHYALDNIAFGAKNKFPHENQNHPFNQWKQIVKWKPALAYQKNISGQTPLDIFTKKIKFYHPSPDEALEKFNKELSLSEARDLKETLIGTIKKRPTQKNRL